MSVVAIQYTFLESYTRIPKAEQRRIQKLVEQLRQDQPNNGLNLERCRKALDPCVYSARLSQGYRMILVRPDQEDVFLLVWVDRHDEAYRWAERRRFVVNQMTGTLQMWTSSGHHEATKDESHPTLFGWVSDRDLQRLGVTKEYLPMVREMVSKSDLKRVQSMFPKDTYEFLDYLASGDSLSEVLDFASELEEEKRKERLTFTEAVTSPLSSRTITVVTSDRQLNEMFHKPFDHWRVFLHPQQRQIVENNFRGPVRVLGGAGTGKTVVAMHRARHLLQHIFSETDDPILFTTFSVTLAKHIEDMLATMCTPSEMKRIAVIPIDSLAKQIVEWVKKMPIHRVDRYQSTMNGIWEKVINTYHWSRERLPFLRSEYEQVIQHHGIESWTDYQNIPRTGRKKRISRAERRRIWDMVQAVNLLKQEQDIYEYTDVLREARKWVETGLGLDHPFRYRAAIIDEAQDMHQEGLKLLRALIPEQANDLFIVGDAHQRIYSRKVVLGQCGIQIRGKRSKRLRINYRTTEEIRQKAEEMIDDMEFDNLDGERDEGKDISLLSGKRPETYQFSSSAEECRFVVEKIRQLIAEGINPNEIAILSPLHAGVEKYLKYLRRESIQVGRLSAQLTTNPLKVQCGTMHSSKGLEFRVVFLVEMNQDIIPYHQVVEQKRSDAEDLQEYVNQQRSLIYVALTRAREQAYITSYGTLSDLVSS